ncbi:GntR family transcriptional regulator [Bhargavaea ginsengi]|uniref:GntR family transcriptional regulator n=1 Tax=Bhargavaea ginsengi TaxID=426757 RepID=UPI00203EBB2C|nr:GntR family transcriptional regulator [Bhargavaea ginsengi]MCM3088047.1 GntR family transcriptional regulator [Bhargavaea ginsengi]
MQIVITNHSKEPIYKQIYNQIKTQILTDELTGGQPLPSMRVLAKELDVSVITTKRAYEELEKSGFIYSVVGKGSFVSEQSNEMIVERKRKVIEEQLIAAIQNSKEIGIGLSELTELLAILYKEEDEGWKM